MEVVLYVVRRVPIYPSIVVKYFITRDETMEEEEGVK